MNNYITMPEYWVLDLSETGEWIIKGRAGERFCVDKPKDGVMAFIEQLNKSGVLKFLEGINRRKLTDNPWIPVSELPTRKGHYWCQLSWTHYRYDTVVKPQREQYFDGKRWRSQERRSIIAWMENPAEYQEPTEEEKERELYEKLKAKFDA